MFADDPRDGVTYCIAEGDFEGDYNEVSQQIKVMCGGQNISMWLIDPSSLVEAKIYGKGRLIDKFRKHFSYLQPANNNRELGWDAVRQAVKPRPNGPKYRTFASCPRTHNQMRNYMWKAPLKSGEDRGKPEVHKRKDDHPDNVRYKMMSVPQKFSGVQFAGFGVEMIN